MGQKEMMDKMLEMMNQMAGMMGKMPNMMMKVMPPLDIRKMMQDKMSQMQKRMSELEASKSQKPYEFPPPLADMLQLSFTHINKDLPRGSIEDNWATHVTSTGNDIVGLP